MCVSKEAKYDHPTQKPLELMRRPILNHTKRGAVVYDPFLGSGTTMMAAELTERICFGIDIDPRYVDVAVLRWQEYTGQEAMLEGNGRTFEQLKAERLGVAA
jgi:DNA modification methylase